MPRRFAVLALVISLTTSCGLGKLADTFRDTTTDTLTVLDKAINDLGAESSNWRQIMEDALRDLPAEASSIVRNDLSDTLNRGIATAGVETRCTIDFIGNRIRQQLIRLRATLLGADAPAPEPAICDVVPLVVDMNLSPEKRNVLELFGYDFDRTTIQVKHVTTSGATTDVTAKLDRPSRYHLTLNLSPNGVAISEASQRLALFWNNEELSTIAVLQKNVPVCDTQSTNAVLKPVPYRPPVVRGDREFAGHGPDISINVVLRIRTDQVGTRRESKIVAGYSMSATEVGGDHTTASGSGETIVWTAPDGFVIDGLPGATSFPLNIRDDTTTKETYPSPLADFVVVGDTEGEDVGETGVDINFRPQTVVIRRDTNCVSARAMIRADALRQLSPLTSLALQQRLSTMGGLRTDLERIPRVLPAP